MKQYILYARLSTKDRGKYGLETQIERMKSYVEEQKGEILQIFEERESGKNDDRPKLHNAVEICKKEKAILLISSLDRLSRSIAFVFVLKNELEKNNIPFEVADMPSLLDYSPSARTMHLGIMATMAQAERERISERVKIGLHRAIASGKSTVKKNLKVKKEDTEKRLEVLEYNRKIVIEIVEKTLKNILPDIVGKLDVVARMLNREGLRTVRNDLWTKHTLILYGFNLKKLKSLGMKPAPRTLPPRYKKRKVVESQLIVANTQE